MSEMVERVARAICLETPGCKIGNRRPDDTDTLGAEPLWHSFISSARAAIATMREPTGKMLDATDDIDIGEYALWSSKAREIWQAMIDEELKNKS